MFKKFCNFKNLVVLAGTGELGPDGSAHIGGGREPGTYNGCLSETFQISAANRCGRIKDVRVDRMKWLASINSNGEFCACLWAHIP